MTTFYDPGPLPGWPIGGPAAKPAAGKPDNSTTAQPAVTSDQAVATSEPADMHTGEVPASNAASTATDEQSANRVETGLGGAPATGGQGSERPAAPAELRVRALRDAVQDAVAFLQSKEPISLRELHNDLLTACATIEDNDLGSDGVTIGQQFEAFFERLRGLMDAHAEPVPTNSLGLPADAQFLSAMAEYLTSSYVLDGEE